MVSSVVPVDRLPDHILSLGWELLEGLFAPLPTDSRTSFMAAYLASPPLVTPSHASGVRSVASGNGSARGVGSVMGGVGVNVLASAPTMGGPGVPGGASNQAVALSSRWPDPNYGVPAPGQPHPELGVPPSWGGVGVHTGVPILNMGGRGAHVVAGFSRSGMGGPGVPGGASVSHGGSFGRWLDPDEGVPTPAFSYHASGFSHASASPCSHHGSPVPSLVAGSASHPSHCSTSLPSSVSCLGYSGDHLVALSSVGGYQGERSSSSSSGPLGGARGRLSSSVYSFPSALLHWGSKSSVGEESDWAESTSDDVLLSLILLPANWFTLSPIKSGEDYLKSWDLILSGSGLPGFPLPVMIPS